MTQRDIGIGLVGAGTVGGGVVKLLSRQGSFFRDRLGLPIRLRRVVDKSPGLFANLPVGDAACSTNASDILDDDSISVVVELVGGTGFARELILDALSRGKHVVTANKALVAEHGPELFQTAQKHGVSLWFEASVGGGMPVIKALREALIGNEIVSVKTIINGTCNYILTQMSTKGLPFAEVLAEAQKKGYAEANPALDVGGGDAGHKVAIMASLMCGGYVPYSAVSVEGITGITPQDIAFADELGYCIKLLGVIRKDEGSAAVDVRVHPAMLHKGHILASVSDVFNAVWLRGDAVGDMLIYGRGAGELPTASAVVSDIVDVARNISGNTPQRVSMDFYRADNAVPIKPMQDLVSRYYLCCTVTDLPSVLASIAAEFGSCGISIASVLQKEGFFQDGVPVIFLTHQAAEKSVRAALAKIEAMDFVRQKTRLIRIED